MDVSQKWRRIKHNLVSSNRRDDDEELKVIANIEQRTSKIVSSIKTFKADVAGTIRTGLNEENIDKRKKKLEEVILCSNLKDASVDLEYMQSTCIHKVMSKIGNAVHFEAEERVKHELMLERRVINDFNNFLETEKQYQKSKEKLQVAYTDLEIAQKAFDKDSSHSHQEALDAAQMKVESLKDNHMAEAMTLATREQEIAKIFASLIEEKMAYHMQMVQMYNKLVPELNNDIDDARPRPVFGVDITEHLRHTNKQISIVIEKCCEFLRKHGFNEKGIFRVNGNNAKMRRIKCAFDSGQYDIDEKHYVHDPFSVCSVLKMYLRELPKPLLGCIPPSEWSLVMSKEGDGRIEALRNVVDKMTVANRNNVAYLMLFLSDLEQMRDQTSMNASNLAIVLGPSLTGFELDGSNTLGSKIVETLIINAEVLFGRDEIKFKVVSPPKIDVPRRRSDEMTQPFQRTITGAISPRSSRPKEKAPPPPPKSQGGSQADLIDFSKTPIAAHSSRKSESDEWSDDVSSGSASQNNSLSRSFTEKRPNRPPPPSNRSSELQMNRPISYHIAVRNNADESTTPMKELGLLGNYPMPTPPERKRQSIIGVFTSTRSQSNPNTTVVETAKSMVTNAGNNRTVVSLDGETTSPPKPKPPLPAKPKELAENQTSRL